MVPVSDRAGAESRMNNRSILSVFYSRETRWRGRQPDDSREGADERSIAVRRGWIERKMKEEERRKPGRSLQRSVCTRVKPRRRPPTWPEKTTPRALPASPAPRSRSTVQRLQSAAQRYAPWAG